MRTACRASASRGIPPNRAEKIPRVERRSVGLWLRIEHGHHLSPHRVAEQRTDEHRRGGADLVFRDSAARRTKPTNVTEQLAESVLRPFGHTGRHLWVLLDLAHGLPNHRSGAA